MELLGLDLTNWLVVLVVLLATFLIYSSWTFGHFKGLGYPGPTPIPVLGNMLHAFKKGFRVIDTERIQRYGKFVATFEGHFPVLLVADVDILKQIMVKEFNNFVNRRNIGNSTFPMRKMLTLLQGDRWRHVRNTVTPTFTTGKLKLMTKQINRCASDFAENLKEKANENQSFEFKKVCGDYTMDVIASTGFGLQVNSQKEENNPFVKHARAIFDNLRLASPFILINFFLPFLRPVLRLLNTSIMPKDTIKFFVDIIDRTMQQRKESDVRQPDFIQLMIEAEARGQGEPGKGAPGNGVAGSETKNALTREEILAQALIFFIAGYETTASTISFIGYNLALNPDVQDKLIDEVDEVCGKNGDVTIEHTNKMTYMEMVVQESMRLYPPAVRVDRVASETITMEGVTIPKDTVVGIPIWHLHHDPNVWPDPEKFDPERFTPEAKAARHPYSYMPFGMGPRNCIGMRLAQTEVKVALAHLLRQYKFSSSEQTQVPLQFKPIGLLIAEKGIMLKLQQRD